MFLSYCIEIKTICVQKDKFMLENCIPIYTAITYNQKKERKELCYFDCM